MTKKKAAAKPLKKQYETFEEKRNLGSRETFVKAAVWNPRLGIHSFAFHSLAQNRSPYRATVSDSLSSLFFKKSDREWIALVVLFFSFGSELHFRSQKTSDSL